MLRAATVLVVICAVVVAGAAHFWPSAPAVVRDLRDLPEVARVDWTGPNGARLVVVHLRDWHFVPKELADVEGLDHVALLKQVEAVQTDQMAIARYLIQRHKVREVFSEGLSPETMTGLTMRVDILQDMQKLASAGKLDAAELRQRRELTLTVGTPGQLLLAKDVGAVLPLEDEKALQDAKPVADGKIVPDRAKIAAREKAMVAHLLKDGMALVVLGGSHDLGPYLPTGTLYVRVTPRSYPE